MAHINRPAVIGLICGAVLIIVAVIFYVCSNVNSEEPIEWELTLVGKNSEQRVLSYEDIRDMPYEKAQGGFFTTVGVINGPYKVKGVLLQDLCNLVGGVTPSDVVSVAATDGYSMVFDYDQLHGDIETYDPATLHEVPHDGLKVLLIYEQDGKTLSHSDGRPLRIAVVSNADLLTEGHYWVKWVNMIEVISLD
jgi:DMSO/TMAO reductase YedYZ molybdopterin-dependent catalytic subunit